MSFKSPRGSNDFFNSVKIWEACRATTAATSFFDPIAVGPYGEEFIDGGTGANNPVIELCWGPDALDSWIQCLVSNGTGIPSLKAFRDDIFNIRDVLVGMATETESTVERFRRDKSHLDKTDRYYRFNVTSGLDDIGLEEWEKKKEIVAATRRYVGP